MHRETGKKVVCCASKGFVHFLLKSLETQNKTEHFIMSTASERIPAAIRPLVSERARKTLDLVRIVSFYKLMPSNSLC